jgi:hypothetical protein
MYEELSAELSNIEQKQTTTALSVVTRH